MESDDEIGYIVSVVLPEPRRGAYPGTLLQGLAGCGLAVRRLDWPR
jgi:hypothetical protein